MKKHAVTVSVIAILLGIAAVGTASALDNSGFEVPDQGDTRFAYGPAGATWSFTGGGGLSGPNGPWKCDSTSPDPLGDQFAYLQGVAAISQNLDGLVVGATYNVSFYEAYRTGQSPSNDLNVILDDGLGSEMTIYATGSVDTTTWEARQTDDFVATKTLYTLTFRATHPLGEGDRTTTIDGVVTNFVSGPGETGVFNLGATDIATTSATFNGTLLAPTTNADVWVHWGATDGTDNAGAWSNTVLVGSWTNVAVTNISYAATGLDASTTYYYTFRATNDATNVWASPSAEFVTATPATPPTAGLAGGATNVAAGTATLRGELTAGVWADATICWGAGDGGTGGTGGWDNVVSVGSVSQGVVFSTTVSGVYYGIEYDYRVYVTNEAGGAWSDAATFAPPLPPPGGEDLGWSYASWTGDVDSGITNAHTYTAAHSFGNNRANVTVNDVTFTENFNSSGTGWSIGGAQNNWNGDDDAAVTGDSEQLAQEFVYNADPRTVQFSGLTIGARYKATFFSVGWEPAGRFQTFLSDGNSLYVDQDVFGNNNGMTVSYVYEATGATQDFSIDAAGGTFHMYALANREDVAPAAIGIANNAAENIGATTADLVGTLDAAQSVFEVTVHWSASNNVDAAAWLADGTASSEPGGTFTNVTGQSVSHSIGSLTGGATYYYTMRASNAATNIWASPSVRFTTASAPAVDTAGGATDVFGFTATLNGELTAGAVADAYICWGTNDVGTSSTGDWLNVESVGTVLQGEPFAANVSGLTPLTTYYYSCYVSNTVAGAWSGVTNFTTTDPNNMMVSAVGGNDSWNVGGNWNQGHAPIGVENAIISNGVAAMVDNGSTPAYSGDLWLGTNASLQVGWTTTHAAHINVLGGGTITMHEGSAIISRAGLGTYTFNQPFIMAGNGTIWSGISTANHGSTKTLAGGISGSGMLTWNGVNRTWGVISTANPSWTGGFETADPQNQRHRFRAGADGCFGTGDVTINNNCSLYISTGLTNAIDNAAMLSLNGVGSSDAAAKLVLESSDTVDALTVNSFSYPTGTYGRVGLGGVDHEYDWMSGNGILTVTNAPADVDPPTVTFVDNQGGGDVYPGQPVTYTVTFNQPVTPDPTTNDFDSASATGVTVDSVTRTGDVTYQVVARATGTGSLQLQIASGAAIEDLFGNALVTPAPDDDTLTVRALPQWKGEFGVLKPWANGGINPETGAAWAVGDTYHLAFVTSGTRDATDPDIATYHAFVQSAAAAVGWGGATWYCVLQTWNDPTRDVNAAPMTTTSGIILADGATLLAGDGPDLANGPGHTFSITEIGTSYSGAVATGSTRKPGDPNQSNIEHGVAWATDGRWWQQYNGAQSSQWHFYAISDPLTIKSGKPTGMTLIVK